MTLLVLAVHSCPCAVEVLPWAACQSGSYHCRTLGVERLLVLNQEIGKLSGADVHAYRLQQFEDFRLTHPACVIQSQHPGSDSRPKLAMVTGRQSSQICLLIAGRVVFLFAKLTV